VPVADIAPVVVPGDGAAVDVGVGSGGQAAGAQVEDDLAFLSLLLAVVPAVQLGGVGDFVDDYNGQGILFL